MTSLERVAVVVACLSLSLVACYERAPQRYRGFFDLPISVQDDSISSLPPALRIEIYLWGATKMGPPQLHLIEPVARGGQLILGPAMDTLRRTEQPLVKERILLLLAEMTCIGYDLSRDSTIMSEIKRAISNVEFGRLQPYALESLGLIEGTRNCAVDREEIRRRFEGAKDS